MQQLFKPMIKYGVITTPPKPSGMEAHSTSTKVTYNFSPAEVAEMVKCMDMVNKDMDRTALHYFN